MTRILPDQDLAPQAAAILCQSGFEAIHVAQIGMAEAEDIAVPERARVDGSVCITLDHDFHAHLAITGHGRPSVVLLRIEGLDARGQANLIRAVCIQCETALSEGAAVSADGQSIRVRRLPLR